MSSEETINSGAQSRGARTHITRTLTTFSRALVMAVLLNYLWLTLGSFLQDRGDSPQRPSPWASGPKNHVLEPQSFCPGCERSHKASSPNWKMGDHRRRSLHRKTYHLDRQERGLCCKSESHLGLCGRRRDRYSSYSHCCTYRHT